MEFDEATDDSCQKSKLIQSQELQSQHSFESTDSDSLDCVWWSIPEPVLIKIFWLLSIRDILNAGLCCRRWYTISNDENMWRKRFQRDFKVEPEISLKPGVDSWRFEYKRLKDNIPFVLSQRLESHAHQVLHVSFSHNGEMFATCSKDGYVIIWNAAHPCTEKFSHNMKHFSWKYTQYSQFNRNDTLLLVSGVYFGVPQSTSGEIAVFTVDGTESHYRCRVVNRPYDIFGTWFSDQYLISGDLRWLEHLVSCSELTLNKANQEIYSEHVPIRNPLYKFYNTNASSVRAIMIAKCPWLDESNDPLDIELSKKTKNDSQPFFNEEPSTSNTAGNPLSPVAPIRCSQKNVESEDSMLDLWPEKQQELGNNKKAADGTIQYLDEYRRKFSNENTVSSESDNDENDTESVEEYDELDNLVPKYLIFSTGSKTYTPHQIGIKRVRNINFPKKLDPGPTLKERIAAKKRAEEQRAANTEYWWNIGAIQECCDKIDKVIDLHGHIIGMALSPDHRYLYVNTRPWPQNYVISNPLEPPPIAQEIDIHVIDLMTLKRVGNMLRAHKAYTPSTECFFIFLDVCDDFVASGAEDMHAYLWDRYYGLCLAQYRHTDVVNSVAFNPRDSGMLVTTSDDYTIKVWRSRSAARKYGFEPCKTGEACELRVKPG